MTDKQFQKIISRTQAALGTYLVLLEEAETEYEKRYGHNPSDVDDDFWIDSMHQSPAPFTVKQLEESQKSAQP